jgi:hypothetical protein
MQKFPIHTTSESNTRVHKLYYSLCNCYMECSLTFMMSFAVGEQESFSLFFGRLLVFCQRCTIARQVMNRMSNIS